MPDLNTLIALAVASLAFVVGAQVLLAGLMAVTIATLALLTGVGYAKGRRLRRLHGRPDPRFEPTQEVFVDPASGNHVRVHADPRTGERRYWRAG